MDLRETKEVSGIRADEALPGSRPETKAGGQGFLPAPQHRPSLGCALCDDLVVVEQLLQRYLGRIGVGKL